MSKIKNLQGQKFGRLTVIGITPKRTNSGSIIWLCECDCGNNIEVSSKDLKGNRVASCGCWNRRVEDLTGQKFGRLKVVKMSSEKGNRTYCECECECGNFTIVRASSLKYGSVKSCGCLHKEIASKDIKGQKFHRLTAIKPTKNRNSNQSVMWECLCDCGNTTLVPMSSLQNGNTKSCGCFHKETVKDNVEKAHSYIKDNLLQEGTYLSALKMKISANNTSGVKGVLFYKPSKKWLAYITFKGVYHHLGYFLKKEDAIKARKKAEEELFEPILEKYGELE